MTDIHTRIKALRLGKDMSMEALAGQVGVQWQAVQLWEKPGGTAPKRARLQRVADALGTTVQYLLFGESPRPPAPPAAPVVAEPDGPVYLDAIRQARPMMARLCDIAAKIDDVGLRNLIDIAECLALNHPLAKETPKSSA